MLMPDHCGHGTRYVAVEVVSLLSHREGRQWYFHNVGKVNRNWEEVRDNFCLAFFPTNRITALRRENINFRQYEKETLGVAWARFSPLTHTRPDPPIPNHVLLQHFWSGLSTEYALQLDVAVGGSFNHKTTAEGEPLLDRILENTSFIVSLLIEEPSPEEVPMVESIPLLLTCPIFPDPNPQRRKIISFLTSPLILRRICSRITGIPRTTPTKRGPQSRLILTSLSMRLFSRRPVGN
jgi:glycerophosphoryl diester phosphodiesterase